MFNDLTDEQAVAALTSKSSARAQVADTFCTHTVVYPVVVKRKAGVEEIEIRNYVTMGQYYPERKMEKVKDVEKRFAKANNMFMGEMKRRGLETYRKDPGNILNASPIDLKK